MAIPHSGGGNELRMAGHWGPGFLWVFLCPLGVCSKEKEFQQLPSPRDLPKLLSPG